MGRFFNPFSKESGIKIDGVQIIDKTISENVKDKIKHYNDTVFETRDPRDWTPLIMEGIYRYTGLHVTSTIAGILMGTHYLKNQGEKGVLDLLIFPLIARKLIVDCALFISNQKTCGLTEKITEGLLFGLKLTAGLSLELMRLAIPVALFAAHLAMLAIILPVVASLTITGIVIYGLVVAPMVSGFSALHRAITSTVGDLFSRMCRVIVAAGSLERQEGANHNQSGHHRPYY